MNTVAALAIAVAAVIVGSSTYVTPINAKDVDNRNDSDVLITVAANCYNTGIFNTLGNQNDNNIPITAAAKYNYTIFNKLGYVSGATNSTPKGLYTVFISPDDVFASLPDRFVPYLLEENNKQVLADVFGYHWISGIVKSTDLLDGKNIPTLLERRSIIVELSHDGSVKINNSTITTVDFIVILKPVVLFISSIKS